MDFNNVKTGITSFFTKKIPNFFNNTFEIKYSKASKITGTVLCLLSLLLVVLSVNTYTSLKYSVRWILLGTDLALPFLLAAITIFTVKLKSERANKIWQLVFIFLMPIITMTMTECLNDVFIYNMTYLGFLGNYIVILVFNFLLFAITGSFRITYLTVNTVLFGLAVGHSYVMDFRGTPFQPMDFLSVTTAANVANTYNFAPGYKIITGLFLFIFIVVMALKTPTPKYNIVTKIVSRCFTATFSGVLIILFYATSVFADMGIRPDFWNQTRGYHNYGFVFNFFANTKYLYMSKPANYDPNEIENIINKNEQQNGNEDVTTEKTPNIICIMNESLSDLKVLGNLTTNEDYMPFMNSLTENTIKGNLYVPVIGAGTSNTEFEFLTGHTTAFLPSGSNAYMLYVKNPLASINSTLKAQNYSSYALHPYYASGWKRPEVYGHFGFNRFTSLEDIMDISLMDQFQNNGSDPNFLQQLVDQYYPDAKNMLVRQYISDSYNYKLIIDDFNKRDKNVPYFTFNVTMQNHGGYTPSATNFNECIYSTSSSQNYNKANKYLSLVKASDDAFKELIEYFSSVKEPTIICMFGDHQPNIEPEFISECLGVNNLSNLNVEQEQNRHITPFYIWANYDIQEQYIDKLSSNYLSSLLLQTAGVKLTEYNKYLLNLSKVLPVINTVGYIDNQNVYYKWSDTSPYTTILNEYEKIQYNAIFDIENTNLKTFYLDGYIHEGTELKKEETD
jgi:phosphoglycerol transferase MdoB-like AlkP superfamily enzyme